MSKIEVDAIEPQSGTTLTVGASGDTITVPSGATFDASNATTTLPSTVVTTTGTQTLTNKTIDASQLSGTVNIAQLGTSGTKDSTTFLRGDNTFAAAGGGKVLQMVYATDSTNRSTTSNSFVTASNTLGFNITPSSTSSKILIIFDFQMVASGSRSYTFYRDGTNLFDSTNGFRRTEGQWFEHGGGIVDEPNTTSQVNYQLYIRANDSLSTSINWSGYGSSQVGYIIGLEIGA